MPDIQLVNAPTATEAERQAILKLRNIGGWWEGDAKAVKVLREFADKVRAEFLNTRK